MGHRNDGAARAYVQNAVMTASPTKLVVMLQDRARSALGAAATARERGDRREFGEALSKVLAIVSELRCSLSSEHGGEIANDLERLYGFVQDRLVSANKDRDDDALAEATEIFETIADAFRGILHEA